MLLRQRICFGICEQDFLKCRARRKGSLRARNSACENKKTARSAVFIVFVELFSKSSWGLGGEAPKILNH